MPTISVISDLHLDISRQPPTLPGGDVLILAGDIAEAGSYSHAYVKDFLQQECADKYNHVFLVIGNHEYYNQTLKSAKEIVRKNTPDKITILDNTSKIIGDTLFIGGTLWTDMNREDPLSMRAIAYGMNDFRLIYKSTVDPDQNVFTVQDAIGLHKETLNYLKTEIDEGQHFDKVVVVTHHAPTFKSVSPRYISDVQMNGGYCSSLEDFILDRPMIKLWVHGHVHSHNDYMVGDDCRVVCNASGYRTRSIQEDTGFIEGFEVEV